MYSYMALFVIVNILEEGLPTIGDVITAYQLFLYCTEITLKTNIAKYTDLSVSPSFHPPVRPLLSISVYITTAPYLASKHVDQGASGQEAVQPVLHRLLHTLLRRTLIQRRTQRNLLLHQLQANRQDRNAGVLAA